jgi:hypothetical protein
MGAGSLPRLVRNGSRRSSVAGVPDEPRQAIDLADDEGGELNAIWSRSGKRLIVTVDRRGHHAQIELTHEQVDELARFLAH